MVIHERDLIWLFQGFGMLIIRNCSSYYCPHITVHIDHIKTYTYSDTPVSWLSQGDYQDKSLQVV